MATALITTTEAAALLGLTRQGVLYLIERKKLQPVDQLGIRGIYVFDRATVEALAKERAA